MSHATHTLYGMSHHPHIPAATLQRNPHAMGWLRLVGSFQLYVSFAGYRLFYRALLQKRHIILTPLPPPPLPPLGNSADTLPMLPPLPSAITPPKRPLGRGTGGWRGNPHISAATLQRNPHAIPSACHTIHTCFVRGLSGVVAAGVCGVCDMP